MPDNDNAVHSVEEYVDYVCRNAVPKAMTLTQVQEASKNDSVIQQLKKAIQFNTVKDWSGMLLQKNVKDELTIADEIILRGHNIVMPADLQEQAVNFVHP